MYRDEEHASELMAVYLHGLAFLSAWTAGVGGTLGAQTVALPTGADAELHIYDRADQSGQVQLAVSSNSHELVSAWHPGTPDQALSIAADWLGEIVMRTRTARLSEAVRQQLRDLALNSPATAGAARTSAEREAAVLPALVDGLSALEPGMTWHLQDSGNGTWQQSPSWWALVLASEQALEVITPDGLTRFPLTPARQQTLHELRTERLNLRATIIRRLAERD